MICAFCLCAFGGASNARLQAGGGRVTDGNGKRLMTLPLGERLHLTSPADYRSLLIAMCINAFGAGMFFPFAMLYYEAATSLSVATIGLVLTAATLLTLAMTPITGILVDRLGAQRLVVASQVMTAAGFGGYLMVSSAGTLFLAALVATSGSRMFYASFSTLIAEMAEGGNRDRLYALEGVTQNVAASASGFLASLVIGSMGLAGFGAAIIGNALCLVATAVLIHRLDIHPNERQAAQHHQGYSAVIRDRPFMMLVASNALFAQCSMLIGVALAIFATDAMRAPVWSIGVIGVLQTCLVVGFQGSLVRRMQPFRRTSAMTIAGFLWVAACLLFASGVVLPAGVAVPHLIIAAMTFTTAQMFYGPPARALAASIGPEALRGRYIATYELSWGLAAAIVPAFFGVTYDVGPATPWLVASMLVAGAMVLLRRAAGEIPVSRNRPSDAIR